MQTRQKSSKNGAWSPTRPNFSSQHPPRWPPASPMHHSKRARSSYTWTSCSTDSQALMTRRLQMRQPFPHRGPPAPLSPQQPVGLSIELEASLASVPQYTGSVRPVIGHGWRAPDAPTCPAKRRPSKGNRSVCHLCTEGRQVGVVGHPSPKTKARRPTWIGPWTSHTSPPL